jgi:hypothetical protein
MRQVRNDYTIRYEGDLYQIERQSIVTGLRKANVRVEKRLDGSIAVRYQERYLSVTECNQMTPSTAAKPKVRTAAKQAKRGSDWNRNFELDKAPPLWKAAQASGYRSGGSD